MSAGPSARQASIISMRPAASRHRAQARRPAPGEVAELASFLCSDRATYITGAVIPVDGGMTATLA
jgi:A-factor type gamma-butyrolactone 1'-reductase (1S-forming)